MPAVRICCVALNICILIFLATRTLDLRAERSDLQFAMGASRVGAGASSRLRGDLNWEQTFADGAFWVSGALETLSILSESRDFAYGFRITPVVGFGRHFEGGPTLSLEKEVARQEFAAFAGSRLHMALWSLRFRSLFDTSLNKIQNARLLRFKQQILLPLARGERREDFVGLSFQFEESLGEADVGARLSAGRVAGLVFMSSIEDLFN